MKISIWKTILFRCIIILFFDHVEYDTLRRLGMNDPQGYVLRRYCDPSNECSVMQLASCAIGEGILKELEGAVDDIATSEVGGWIDVLVSLIP